MLFDQVIILFIFISCELNLRQKHILLFVPDKEQMWKLNSIKERQFLGD